MNLLRRAILASAAALLTWAPTVAAYNFYPHDGLGGWLGYTYNKWGAPALGTGATVYWSIMPAGTPGSAYCAPGCTNGSGVSSLVLPNFYDWNTHSFRSVSLTDPEVMGYIRNALRTWSAAAGITFLYLPADSGVPVNDPAAEPPPQGATGQIRIGVFDLGGSGSAAAGFAPPPNGFEPDNIQFATGAGDLIINGNAGYAYQNPAGAEGSPLNAYPQGGGLFLNDLQGLILHEIGHTLGLEHSAAADAVMCGYTWWTGNSNGCTYYSPATYVINRQLSSDDGAGMQTLYGQPVDSDSDGVPDAVDNCRTVSNATQVDSDSDGFGNRCDGDMNNNLVTNSQDYVLFRAQLGAPSVAPLFNKGDINANGVVNSQDYVLFRALLGSPPGPSGLYP